MFVYQIWSNSQWVLVTSLEIVQLEFDTIFRFYGFVWDRFYFELKKEGGNCPLVDLEPSAGGRL